MSAKKVVNTEPVFTPFTIVVDSREQNGFTFQNYNADADKKYRPLIVRTTVKALESGDYSLVGYEKNVTIERKSLDDAYTTFSQDRDRFERELSRLLSYDFAAVVIEAPWSRILGRICPECSGIGKLIPKDQMQVVFAVERMNFCDFMDRPMYEAIRIHCERITTSWPKCERCFGIGKLPATESQFHPKSFFRSVIAWQVRFPTVHWHFCDSRRFAELITLRQLERYFLDAEKK